jgi:transposase
VSGATCSGDRACSSEYIVPIAQARNAQHSQRSALHRTLTLSVWRDAFLAAGEAILTTKPATGEEPESERLKAKLGAALIERDLLQERIAILEANRPLARRRLRR